MRKYLSELRHRHKSCHARSCETIQRDPTVHNYIKYQNQAWRDAFDLTRNATKRAALDAGRIAPPVYGNIGGPFVHPFALVMTQSVDVCALHLLDLVL